MSDEQKYTIQGLDEYIRQGEPQQRERSEAWKVAIGLQQVDRLKTSEYLLDTAKLHMVNDVFAENSWYFRNALVRANYNDLTAGISETTLYLERFFRSMLLGEEHDLRNRIMHVDWGKSTEGQSANKPVQSAKLNDELPPKCKNCTLEEVAVLRMMHENLGIYRVTRNE